MTNTSDDSLVDPRISVADKMDNKKRILALSHANLFYCK
jgi:hypothetical protein